MTSRTPALRILIGLTAGLAMTLVAPSPAQAVTVTLNTSRTSAVPSVPVTFSGSATGAPTGVPVSLQRRLGSGSWSTVKTGGTVSASDTYSLTTYVAAGTYSYRAKVGSSAYSPAKTVSGTYGRNVMVPAAGSPFTLSAWLPMAKSRVVKAQFSTDGTPWTTRGQATSSSAGGVGIRTYLVSTSYVRAIAPATSTLPTWVGPRGVVTIGVDPVIKKILDDTNAHRASHAPALPALKLHPSLNKIAGNWAYTMATKCVFKHNTTSDGRLNVSEYPAGWKSAGENIAAGATYETVVGYWIGSAPHHANIDGGSAPKFTHIGIGYYFGGSCSDTTLRKTYVQNFATY